MIDLSMKIDPDGWYTAHALWRLGIPEPRIDQAVNGGHLKATDFTLNPLARQQAKLEHDATIRRRGQDPEGLPYLEGLQFLGAEVLAWIGAGLPTGNKTRAGTLTGRTAPKAGVRTIVRSTTMQHTGRPPSMNSAQVIQDWNEKVTAKMESTHVNKSRAVFLVARENPGLQKQFLLACNPSKRARRLIDEKFDD